MSQCFSKDDVVSHTVSVSMLHVQCGIHWRLRQFVFYCCCSLHSLPTRIMRKFYDHFDDYFSSSFSQFFPQSLLKKQLWHFYSDKFTANKCDEKTICALHCCSVRGEWLYYWRPNFSHLPFFSLRVFITNLWAWLTREQSFFFVFVCVVLAVFIWRYSKLFLFFFHKNFYLWNSIDVFSVFHAQIFSLRIQLWRIVLCKDNL